MELQKKISQQETLIKDLKYEHDNNLKYISVQLFQLQTSLMEKETNLSQLIREREQVYKGEFNLFQSFLHLESSMESGLWLKVLSVLLKIYIPV